MREHPQTGIVVDKSRFPVVLVWFGKSYTDAEWAGSLDEIGVLANGDASFVVINVARPDMDTPTASQRKVVAEWNNAYVASGRRTIIGWGNIIESNALRGVLTAIAWLTSFPYEYKIFAKLDQGLAWAEQLLAHAKAKQG